MARPGPQPKNTPKHGHSGGAGFVDVVNVPYSGPGAERDLPAIPGMEWFPQVVGWWEVVRRMPHCTLWEASDWLFAIETAMLKNYYMAEFFGGVVHATMASEIRRREDQLGTTMEARRKLGIRYMDPIDDAQAGDAPGADTTASGVTPIERAPSRRQQLAG